MAKPVQVQELIIPEVDIPNLCTEGETQENTLGRKNASKTKNKRRYKSSNHIIGQGVNSKSPTIYITDKEKEILKKFKAHLLLETGISKSDHEIFMESLKLYIAKNDKEFYEKYLKL